MYFFKKRPIYPSIQLYRSNGELTPLRVIFRNGEIHINPDALDKGSYRLTVSEGKEQVLSQSFTIS